MNFHLSDEGYNDEDFNQHAPALQLQVQGVPARNIDLLSGVNSVQECEGASVIRLARPRHRFIVALLQNWRTNCWHRYPDLALPLFRGALLRYYNLTLSVYVPWPFFILNLTSYVVALVSTRRSFIADILAPALPDVAYMLPGQSAVAVSRKRPSDLEVPMPRTSLDLASTAQNSQLRSSHTHCLG